MRVARFALAAALASAAVVGIGGPARADVGLPQTAGLAVVSVEQSVSDEGVDMTQTTFADGSFVQAAQPREPEGEFFAAAAAGCGTACDGREPDHLFKPDPHNSRTWYRCSSDAKTVFSYYTGPGELQIELRYSAHCRSAWARGWRYHDFYVESFKNGDPFKRSSYWKDPHTNPETRTWTAMVNDKGLVARACVLRANTNIDLWCTSKY